MLNLPHSGLQVTFAELLNASTEKQCYFKSLLHLLFVAEISDDIEVLESFASSCPEPNIHAEHIKGKTSEELETLWYANFAENVIARAHAKFGSPASQYWQVRIYLMFQSRLEKIKTIEDGFKTIEHLNAMVHSTYRSIPRFVEWVDVLKHHTLEMCDTLISVRCSELLETEEFEKTTAFMKLLEKYAMPLMSVELKKIIDQQVLAKYLSLQRKGEDVTA